MSPESSSPAVRNQSKRRVLTPARREQNRLAQKIYRQRQKERKEKRHRLATSGEQPPTLRPKGDDTLPRESTEVPTWTGTTGNVPNSDLVTKTLDEWVALVDPQGSFEQCLYEVQLTAPPLPDLSTESQSLYPLQSDGTFPHAGNTRSIHSDTAVSPLSQTPWEAPAEDSTAKTSTRGTNPYSSDGSRADPSRLPSPEANARQTVHTTVFSAMLQNALALGFDLLELSACATTYMSPFYRAGAKPQDHPGRLTSEALAGTSRDADTVPVSLRPTLAQVLIPHHASLDLIPFPRFRDRIIMLSAGLPHLFNLWELKMDIYVHGALVVSPSARQSGTCQPWNWKSWEAAPWFLRKWSMAVNSEQGRQVTELS